MVSKVVEALSVGLKRGHVVKKKTVSKRGTRKPLSRRGKLAKELVREVTGYSPYERRVMEYLKNGLDKRALKLAKKKLGSHQRAKGKREELNAAIRKAVK
eukprot:TRINITY_DN1386_c0_g1_i1.p1 TRINITY_DN1386_c0_g1~~TRINITY_DN1386_c0_g1_i1.p1  ORF type:complete len:100 (+),score=31.68 TRINITY_DN1386_c0_g1_i1:27-326(+)